MDRRMYYRSAGLSAARRAFYSYTAQPRGSYGLPLIFLKMLKAQKVITFEEDKERWRSFLCDYIVFRLYIAKYVLKSYARDYSPLTELYSGFKDAEKDWPGFIRSSSDPGWEAAGISFLPKDLSSYTEKEMDNHHEFFDRIAKEAEAKTQNGGHALKGLVSESLTAISKKNHLPLLTPVFWFFEKETAAYAQYLSSYYRGLIPDSYYETVKAHPYRLPKKESDPYTQGFRLAGFILLFIAVITAFLLAAPGMHT